MIFTFFTENILKFFNYFKDIGVVFHVMVFQVHFDVDICDVIYKVAVNFHFDVGLDVSETCELMEVSSEVLSGLR